MAGALAAALPAMVARLALGRPSPSDPTSLQQLVNQADAVRRRLHALAAEDAVAFRSVIAARRTKDEASLEAAWLDAAQVPAEVVKQCLQVAQLARRAARQGPPAAVADSVVAALLAAAAAAGSQINLRLNVEAAGRPPRLRVLLDESEAVLRETQRAARDVRLMVDERRVQE
jgi:formiminotetrahydrofolate cyclodeaminase